MLRAPGVTSGGRKLIDSAGNAGSDTKIYAGFGDGERSGCA
jgi:hypothetical protein